jgi:hypothetical protein
MSRRIRGFEPSPGDHGTIKVIRSSTSGHSENGRKGRLTRVIAITVANPLTTNQARTRWLRSIRKCGENPAEKS